VTRDEPPFELGLPNATTLRAMRAAEAGRVTRAKSIYDFFAKLDAEE
jgi:antitoxin component of RelBE/YafQ-DinJ toxin-antitoxin module